MHSLKRASLAVLLTLLLSGCMATGKGVVHTVGKGETFWRICKTYGVSMQEVAELNNIKDTTGIEAGRKLFIPGVSRKKKVTPYVPSSSEQDHEEKETGRIEVIKDRFVWPVSGEVVSPYGMRNGSRHDGIDIKAADGSPVVAAESGEVVHVSHMRGYGNIVILKHEGEFYTVYAHNKVNLVKANEKVKKGETIAKVGSTGNATMSHLHFEVRQGKDKRNPLFFLPDMAQEKKIITIQAQEEIK